VCVEEELFSTHITVNTLTWHVKPDTPFFTGRRMDSFQHTSQFMRSYSSLPHLPGLQRQGVWDRQQPLSPITTKVTNHFHTSGPECSFNTPRGRITSEWNWLLRVKRISDRRSFFFFLLLFVCFGVALCVHPSYCVSVCVSTSLCSCVTSHLVDSTGLNTNTIGFLMMW